LNESERKQNKKNKKIDAKIASHWAKL